MPSSKDKDSDGEMLIERVIKDDGRTLIYFSFTELDKTDKNPGETK